MIRMTGLDHIVLNVRDVDRSLQFYSEVLGAPSERVAEYRAGEVGFPSVRINEQTIIDLFPPERRTGVESEGFAQNVNHVCLVIANEDIHDVITHLGRHGFQIERGPTHGWGARGRGTSVYFRDPDNNLIELRTYAPASMNTPAAP